VPGAVGDAQTGGNLVTEAEVEDLRLTPLATDDTGELAGVAPSDAAAGPGSGGSGGSGGDGHWSAVVGRGGRAVARMGTRSRVRPGDTVKLAVDPVGVHLFDSTSGVSLRTTGP
jgi:hypothetical protein